MIDILYYYQSNTYDPVLWEKLWKECQNLYGISEALRLEVFEHVCFHYKENKGNMKGYVLRVAQGLKKAYNKREICVDTLELIEASDKATMQNDNSVSLTDIVEDRVLEAEGYDRVAEFALSNNKYFLKYGEDLLNKAQGKKTFYPSSFKMSAIKLMANLKCFHKYVRAIYKEHADSFSKFLESTTEGVPYLELERVKPTKLVSLGYISEDGSFVETDTPDLYLDKLTYKGGLKFKRIIRVPVREFKDKLFDLIDSEETNPLKYYIGKHYVFKTLGGSLSFVDSPNYTEYALIEDELAHNLSVDLKAQVICNDSDNIYLLQKMQDNGTYNTIPHRVINGVEINLECIVMFEG